MKITRKCPFTGKINTMDLNITVEQYNRYLAGELAQNVFPHLTADQREFIITGITADQWPDKDNEYDDGPL